MFGKQRTQQGPKSIVLAHQDMPPSVKQLQKMLDDTLHNTGMSIQMPFGSPPECFTLMVTRDPMRGIVHWMLYRGEGVSSFLEWEQKTTDPNWIFNLIEAAFPQMGRRKTLTEEMVPQDQMQTARLTKVEAPAESQSNFEGDLQNMAIPNLIQSVDMNALTGRLDLDNKAQRAVIYFQEGKPIHCIVDQTEGEHALLEVIAWTHGKFRFFKEDARQHRTIDKPLHHLLMAGAALQDQINLLRDKGLGLDTYLIKKHSNLPEAEYNKLLAEQTGCDEKLQKTFYSMIDDRTPIVGILAQLPMNKATWVPIVFNMVTCNLCSYKNAADFEQTKPVSVSWNEVHQISALLSNGETAIYTHQAYLYFLALEYYRFRRFKLPFSTVIINAGIRSADNHIYPLHGEAFRILGHHIKQVLRETDLLFHFGDNLACILPCTDSAMAKQFASHLTEILNSAPITTSTGTFGILATLGTATIPDSCESVDALITLAQPRAL